MSPVSPESWNDSSALSGPATSSSSRVQRILLLAVFICAGWILAVATSGPARADVVPVPLPVEAPVTAAPTDPAVSGVPLPTDGGLPPPVVTEVPAPEPVPVVPVDEPPLPADPSVPVLPVPPPPDGTDVAVPPVDPVTGQPVPDETVVDPAVAAVEVPAGDAPAAPAEVVVEEPDAGTTPRPLPQADAAAVPEATCPGSELCDEPAADAPSVAPPVYSAPYQAAAPDVEPPSDPAPPPPIAPRAAPPTPPAAPASPLPTPAPPPLAPAPVASTASVCGGAHGAHSDADCAIVPGDSAFAAALVGHVTSAGDVDRARPQSAGPGERPD